MQGLEGKTLGGYTLQKVVGRGGMADVYLGCGTDRERKVAIKVFKRDDERLLKRFVREINLMSSLRHPHLVPIYAAGDASIDGFERYYIIMPYFEGGTLRGRFRRSPLPTLELISNFLNEIASALDYIHQQGIIHRDIKPSNVLLDPQERCYLSDFGISRMTTSDTNLTTTGRILGTADYVAPEMFVPQWKMDTRCDLYSLGVLLYEMVTGRLPFIGETALAVVSMHVNEAPPQPRRFVPNLSPQVEQVLLKALEKDPNQRYSTAGELAHAFSNALLGRMSANRRIPLPGIWIESSMQEGRNSSSTGPGEHRSLLSSSPSHAVQANPPSNHGQSFPSAYPMGQAYSAPPVQQASPMQVSPMAQRMTPPSPSHMVSGPPAFPSTPQPAYHAMTSPAPPDNARRQPPRKQRRTGIIVLICLLVLLLLLGSLLLYGLLVAPSKMDRFFSRVTGSAGTTIVSGPVQPRDAGMLNPLQKGHVLFKDTLLDANSANTLQANWDENDHCIFANDGYHVKIDDAMNQGPQAHCAEAGITLLAQRKNKTIGVDTKIMSGGTGGLFFNVHPNRLGTFTGYLFEVDAQGYYRIVNVSHFRGTTVLKDWTSSPALHPGYGMLNTLWVSTHDTTFTFYANGVRLTSVDDVSGGVLVTGDVAFFASAAQDGTQADVLYGNLTVYSLP